LRRSDLVVLCAVILGCGVAACAQMKPAIEAGAPQPVAAGSYGNYLSARLAASDHNMTDAARLYNASLAADPNNTDILNHAFLYTAASGDVRDAADLARRVVANEADNRAARLALAVEAMKSGDYAAARTQIAQSAKGPFTALTLTLLDAWACAGQGDLKTAEIDLKQVTTDGGTETLMNFHHAMMLELVGQNEAADAAYRAAISTGAASPRIAEAYGRFLERSGRAADTRAYYAKLQSDAALAPIANAGLARVNAGKTPDRLASSPGEGAAEALFGIAASLNDENSADIAILYLRLSLYLSPRLDLAKILLADRFEALAKLDDAVAVYRTLDKDSPYGPAASVQIALDDSRMDRNDEAIAELQALIRARPDDTTAWTALGDAYRNVEKFTEAADAYDHAVKTLGAEEAKDWPLYYARAVAEERSHRWDAAEGDLQHALKLSPEQPQVLNYLGYSWVDQGRNLPEALAMLEKARTLSPNDGYIVDSVGWAYYRLGRYQDATKALENAILLVPGDVTINEHLGDAYWKVGRRLEAHYQWSHALAFGPDATQKAELEKKLKSGSDSVVEQP